MTNTEKLMDLVAHLRNDHDTTSYFPEDVDLMDDVEVGRILDGVREVHGVIAGVTGCDNPEIATL